MSDLDRELREAAEAPAPAAAVPPRPPVAPPRPSGRNIGLLVGLLVVAGAILALVFSSVDEAAIYSLTTDRLLAERDKYKGRTVRVEGDLVKGTLTHRAEPCEYRFVVEKQGARLPVRYAACVIPDTFKDVPYTDVQVTAEGRLSPEGYFEATHIMAKCPSKYEMQNRAARGELAPHQPPAPGLSPTSAPSVTN